MINKRTIIFHLIVFADGLRCRKIALQWFPIRTILLERRLGIILARIKQCLKRINEPFISLCSNFIKFHFKNINISASYNCFIFFPFCFRHPLFPLLALLFERCEQATQLAETPNSESFNMDIQAFVQHQERDRKPFLVNDAEIDGLVKTILANI